MAAPVLSEFTFQLGDSGVLLNADGGTPYIDVDKVEGLGNAPFKSTSKELDGMDGGMVTTEFEGIREVTIGGYIYGGSDPIEPLIDNLKANYAPTPDNVPFYFKAAGVAQRMLWCKSQGFSASWEAMRRFNSTPFSIKVLCEDPTIYGVTERTASVYLGTSTSGYTFPRAFSYTFGGSNVPNSPPVHNYGNKPVGFKLQFTGQTVVNPRITHETLNKTVRLNLTAAGTDEILVDFQKQQVYFNGAARRKAVVEEGWFLLQPGDNRITLQSDSSIAVTGNIIYYDGYR
jgi:hypothetical protein